MSRLPLALALLTLPLLSVACGGGSGEVAGVSAQAPTSPSSPSPFEPAPPPALWTDDGCAGCHGADASGGIGPDIRCTSYDQLDAYLRSVSTSHVGGAFPQLTDEELLQLEDFLRTADCPATIPGDPTAPPPSGGVPASHTENEDGVLHHPDYETNIATCTTCHGANLEGTSFAPACATCHGGGGFDDDEFDDEVEHGDEVEEEHESETETEHGDEVEVESETEVESD